MAKRCLASTQAVAVAMKPVFELDNVKGSFFRATLPDTISSTAYAARQAALRQTHGLTVTASCSAPGLPTTNECTWCWKHDLTFTRHVYTNCNELRKHKERQQKTSRSSK